MTLLGNEFYRVDTTTKMPCSMCVCRKKPFKVLANYVIVTSFKAALVYVLDATHMKTKSRNLSFLSWRHNFVSDCKKHVSLFCTLHLIFSNFKSLGNDKSNWRIYKAGHQSDLPSLLNCNNKRNIFFPNRELSLLFIDFPARNEMVVKCSLLYLFHCMKTGLQINWFTITID